MSFHLAVTHTKTFDLFTQWVLNLQLSGNPYIFKVKNWEKIFILYSYKYGNHVQERYVNENMQILIHIMRTDNKLILCQCIAWKKLQACMCRSYD